MAVAPAISIAVPSSACASRGRRRRGRRGDGHRALSAEGPAGSIASRCSSLFPSLHVGAIVNRVEHSDDQEQLKATPTRKMKACKPLVTKVHEPQCNQRADRGHAQGPMI